MLVTSREALRVRGEHLVDVPPLTRARGRRTGRRRRSPTYEAVRLFVGARPGGTSGLRADGRQRGGGGRDQRSARRPAARDRARRGEAQRCSRPRSWTSGCEAGSSCSAGDRATCPRASRRCGARSSGATSCWTRRSGRSSALLSVFAPARVEAVEQVAGRLEPLRGLDVVEQPRLARRQEPRPQRRQRGLAAAVDARDDPRVRARSGSRRCRSRQRCATGACGALRRLRASRRGSASTAPEREQTLDELGVRARQPADGVALLGRAPATSGSSRSCSTRCGRSTTPEAGITAAIDLTNDLLARARRPLRRRPSTRGRRSPCARASRAGSSRSAATPQEVEDALQPGAGRSPEASGELPQRAPVLRSLASFHLYRGEFEKTATFGGQLLELAEQEGDAGLQVGRAPRASARASPSAATCRRGWSTWTARSRSSTRTRHPPGALSPRARAPASWPTRRRRSCSGYAAGRNAPRSWGWPPWSWRAS